MINLIEAAPLVVFLIYIRNIDTSVGQNWQGPFIVSGLVALGIIAFFLFRKKSMHRLFLGINLYLFSGGLAFVTHQGWLNQLYGDLLASGMLAWIIAVGVVTLFTSPTGFIGVATSDKAAVKRYSFYLLLIAIGAFSVSFLFRGDRFLSEIVPFLTLFFIHRSFQSALAGKGDEN